MTRKVLIIDNYDSFTYNLYQLVGSRDASVDVFRNDEITMAELKKRHYSHVIIGPGPKRPEDSALSVEAMNYYGERLPVLGVCLGMQLMAHLHGGTVIPDNPVHGKSEKITHTNSGIHRSLPSPFKCARYNSLVVSSIDESHLEVTARNMKGVIMGLRHRKFPNLEGVQYHPESFLSQHGDILIDNFLENA